MHNIRNLRDVSENTNLRVYNWGGEGYPSYDGCMCGASSEQEQTYRAQQALFNTLNAQAQQIFGYASGIFKELKSQFSPIFDKGPEQYGFAGAEDTALRSQATTGAGLAYNQAHRAINERLAAEGGVALPSGTQAKIDTGLAVSGAQNLSNEQLGITEAGYEQGRQNWLTAAGMLAGAPSVFSSSTAAGNAAVGAGSAAAKEANAINQSNSSWMNLVSGALGAASSSFGAYEGAH